MVSREATSPTSFASALPGRPTLQVGLSTVVNGSMLIIRHVPGLLAALDDIATQVQCFRSVFQAQHYDTLIFDMYVLCSVRPYERDIQTVGY